MRNTTCLFSATAALHRVFIASTVQQQLPNSLRSSQRIITRVPSTYTLLRCRSIATSAPSSKREVRLPRDEEITAWSVILVNPDGSRSQTQDPARILSTLDRDRQSLVQLTPQEPGQAPLCRIVDKKKLYEDAKAKAKNARNTGVTLKTLELNWAIEAGDLEHRLKRLREFLEKGFKVEVTIAPKRRGKIATFEQANEVLSRITQTVEGTTGTRQNKPRVGKIGGEMTIFAEGTAKVVEKVKETKSKEKGRQRGEKLRDDVPQSAAEVSA